MDAVAAPVEAAEPVKAKRTRKCKAVMAMVMIENDTAMAPVSGFPSNIISMDKAVAWCTKNAKENEGPKEVIFVRMLGSMHITTEVKMKVKVV